ncbi:hydrogenase maturation nickel metallochaperone HypA [Campylobacter sp. RM12642]|uniref:hydrogenase maturation nickel metallochaperone HypA/HybF n=1 Tax=unclassified Campylobacter TaxID=2593542 RepID=UPI001E16E7B0|nr:hydrogenase maturation nickel metallochaperone HypA [Campylobacter sp. RM12642]MBZ8006927.1 hydrogenase maturation nickel metallochaperone HypA [Campylobacter sp. RM9334]
MHEMAIVNNLLDECERIKINNKATKITRVRVSIGRLSGVEEHYFKEAFNAFTSDNNSSYYNAKLEVVLKELELFCKDCNCSFIQNKNEFCCKNCSSNNVEIKSGDELLLEQVELE